MPVPFPVVTTFKTAGTYKKWLWPNSAHITYAWHALLIWHTYLHTYIYIYIYIYIYRTSSNLYTPDSVSLASLARQLIGERAKRARHYQGCTNSSWCGTYIYIYIYVWRYVCHISSACHVYVMWAELRHIHFLYVPAVSNVVTNGNGTGTKYVLKGTVSLGLSLVSSLLSTAQLL